MVIHMDISDEAWIAPYFATVPALLGDYGAQPLAGSRSVQLLEGADEAPDRLAIIRFPSLDHIHRFMSDPRYQPFRAMRERGSTASIFVFEDESNDGALA